MAPLRCPICGAILATKEDAHDEFLLHAVRVREIAHRIERIAWDMPAECAMVETMIWSQANMLRALAEVGCSIIQSDPMVFPTPMLEV